MEFQGIVVIIFVLLALLIALFSIAIFQCQLPDQYVIRSTQLQV